MTETPMVVVLGAGRPFAGTEPSALVQTSGDKRVLDWILDAFETSLPGCDVHFVGGYRMEDVVEEYPTIHFSRNEDWETSGTVASLFTAPVSNDRPVYVCYADTIFESGAIDDLSGKPQSAIGVDHSWQARYRSRSRASLERAEKVRIEGDRIVDADVELAVESADAEFTGLLRFLPDTIARARALWESRTIDATANLPTLLRALIASDQEIAAVDIGDRWAELETTDDLSRFVLDTKANTLRRLQSMVDESVILDQETFTVGDWQADPDAVYETISTAFEGSTVIIRSSSFAEDTWESSNAGRFESVLDVPVDDGEAIADAIDRVIESYHDPDFGDQVLVQPMVDDVAASGVIMTRTLEGNGPYYVVNYDATTASTESVTDGTGEHLQTAIVRRDLVTNGFELTVRDERDSNPAGETNPDTSTDRTGVIEPTSVQYPLDLPLEPVLRAVRELEELIAHGSLDVEFAIDKSETVYVFQARPMTLDPGAETVDDETVFATVDAARKEFQDSQQASPFVLGDRTIYGVMPDWNPAEIIGRQPRQLAASLYRYLVMNETWAIQRAEYGYRDVGPQPLMKQFAGQPYVDVRADVNSFIPSSVPDSLAERLVTYYLDRLEANPELHDKIEFEVVLTCLTFDYNQQIAPLLEAGFTRDELDPFRAGLGEITRTAYNRTETDLAEIATLSDRFELLSEADLPPLHAAYYLLADCRRYGTLPFAHLARTAFVATALLRSLERKGILDDKLRGTFQNSLNTVARQFDHDAYRVSQHDLSWEEFVDRYGHLRPGTYEITSPTYEQAPEEYLGPVVERATPPDPCTDPAVVWDAETRHSIEKELEAIGLPSDADRFVTFLVDAIEGREYAKFVFSRNLSEALERIAEFGTRYGFDREEISHVSIEDLFKLYVNHPPPDVENWLADRVRNGRRQHATTRAVELPPLLFGDTDFLVFERAAGEPNFVTNTSVTADVFELDGRDGERLTGKIVLIPQADPGFDWLFGHDITGLVTMYGGTNSHMAVRAAEFDLPAAIGVGEGRYDQLRRAEVLELNCGGQYIRVIQ